MIIRALRRIVRWLDTLAVNVLHPDDIGEAGLALRSYMFSFSTDPWVRARRHVAIAILSLSVWCERQMKKRGIDP